MIVDLPNGEAGTCRAVTRDRDGQVITVATEHDFGRWRALLADVSDFAEVELLDLTRAASPPVLRSFTGHFPAGPRVTVKHIVHGLVVTP